MDLTFFEMEFLYNKNRHFFKNEEKEEEMIFAALNDEEQRIKLDEDSEVIFPNDFSNQVKEKFNDLFFIYEKKVKGKIKEMGFYFSNDKNAEEMFKAIYFDFINGKCFSTEMSFFFDEDIDDFEELGVNIKTKKEYYKKEFEAIDYIMEQRESVRLLFLLKKEEK